MSEFDEMMGSAREFMAYSRMSDNLEDVVNNSAPLKVGVNLDSLEIIIGVHDKMFFMNEQMAEATMYALYLACQTIRAAAAARSN